VRNDGRQNLELKPRLDPVELIVLTAIGVAGREPVFTEQLFKRCSDNGM
jgi:hypothetical protein